MTMTTPKQLCTIRIMLPVDSDDEAIALKKKVSDALGTNSEAVTRFSLDTLPSPKQLTPG